MSSVPRGIHGLLVQAGAYALCPFRRIRCVLWPTVRPAKPPTGPNVSWRDTALLAFGRPRLRGSPTLPSQPFHGLSGRTNVSPSPRYPSPCRQSSGIILIPSGRGLFFVWTPETREAPSRMSNFFEGPGHHVCLPNISALSHFRGLCPYRISESSCLLFTLTWLVLNPILRLVWRSLTGIIIWRRFECIRNRFFFADTALCLGDTRGIFSRVEAWCQENERNRALASPPLVVDDPSRQYPYIINRAIGFLPSLQRGLIPW